MGSVSMGNGDIIRILDLTLLDRGASEEDLIRLCERAVTHRAAAVCVFSEHVRFVRDLLPEEVRVASVVGGFPVGWRDPVKVSKAITEAIDFGTDEIDCVLEPQLHDSFPGESELALLLAMREASGDKILKVIIETPLLDEHSIRATSRLAMASGADFVKTCTGKRGDCTDEDARILSMEANRHLVTMGERKGVKISGGIRKTEDARRMLSIMQKEGISTGNPNESRIGASSLLDDLIDGGLGRN
tara:strand:+ start:37606 stop:38340 length:735 start_codon:yes stop_codon:yes gene_type:complete